AERGKFVDIMIALLEERALFSKEQAATRSKKEQKYRVTYLNEKFLDGAKTKAQVITKLAIPSERLDVQLSYKLRKRGAEWKIYDVIVDGASLLENYRYQFNDIITKHGYDDLVGRMTKKLGEIKGKRQGTS
ncbi:MAG: ABC transporter substrate-binding protein, partial [Deltaproteobacteria bacterium]|nr:ABC transporter substrate-binding protein [Deltaproteobacteria bacterium]